MRRERVIELRDPRTDPRRGDVIERIMRPLKNPKQRQVLALRTNGAGHRLVRYKTPFGRPVEVRVEEWARWATTGRIVKRG